MDTLSEPALPVARSCLPSPLKSPTATEKGTLPTPKFVAALKFPAPSPNRIETLFEPRLTTARSWLPSPLKSLTTTKKGTLPTAKFPAALKLPAPSPNRIDTVFETMSTTARSWLLSRLKSPTATEKGEVPAAKCAAGAKLTGVQVVGVVTVSVNVLVAVAPPLSKAVTVTVYVPAGCASVTRTTPVAGSPSSFPLKSVEAETLMLVVFAGAASGEIVVSPL